MYRRENAAALVQIRIKSSIFSLLKTKVSSSMGILVSAAAAAAAAAASPALSIWPRHISAYLNK